MPLDPAIRKLYEDLPEPGQGADGCRREAIRLLPPLRTPPAIIDLGCGRGHQTIVLASHFKSPVIAVDESAVSLERMREAAVAAGVEKWIHPRLSPLTQISDPPGSFDLIWSEAGARELGMEKALAAWSPLLRNRGVLVLGDCSWLQPDQPEEALQFWRHRYPAMIDVDSVHRLAREAGLRVYDSFNLPRSAWRTVYSEPLSRRIDRLRDEAKHDPALEAAIGEAEKEIALFERWGDRVQYLFYLMRRN